MYNYPVHWNDKETGYKVLLKRFTIKGESYFFVFHPKIIIIPVISISNDCKSRRERICHGTKFIAWCARLCVCERARVYINAQRFSGCLREISGSGSGEGRQYGGRLTRPADTKNTKAHRYRGLLHLLQRAARSHKHPPPCPAGESTCNPLMHS